MRRDRDATRLARRAFCRALFSAWVLVLALMPVTGWASDQVWALMLAVSCFLGAVLVARDGWLLRARLREVGQAVDRYRPPVPGPHACPGCNRNHFGPCQPRPPVDYDDGPPERIIPLNPGTGRFEIIPLAPKARFERWGPRLPSVPVPPAPPSSKRPMAALPPGPQVRWVTLSWRLRDHVRILKADIEDDALSADGAMWQIRDLLVQITEYQGPAMLVAEDQAQVEWLVAAYDALRRDVAHRFRQANARGWITVLNDEPLPPGEWIEVPQFGDPPGVHRFIAAPPRHQRGAAESIEEIKQRIWEEFE